MFPAAENEWPLSAIFLSVRLTKQTPIRGLLVLVLVLALESQHRA